MLACRRLGRWRCSHLVVSSCGAVLRFLLACVPSRLAVSSHRPSSRSSPPRASTRLDGAMGGERRCPLLTWLYPVGWADVDSSFMSFPLRYPLALLACLSARLWGDGALISSCGMCCDVLLACGSSRLSLRLSSRRSGRFCVSLPVFRHDERGGERMRCGCGVLSVLRSDFAVCLVPPCLLASGRFSPSI